MGGASFDFQMAGRQIRRAVALTNGISTLTYENHNHNHNQFCVASPLVYSIFPMWYLLGHLEGVFNRQQQVRGLRSYCSSAIVYKACTRPIPGDMTALQISDLQY
jgi:hypothetical protein